MPSRIVLLPRLTSADEEEVRWMTPSRRATRCSSRLAGAVALAIAGAVLLPAIFGSDYDGSRAALWLLLPGTVALTGSKVLTSYIFSRGRPLVNTRHHAGVAGRDARRATSRSCRRSASTAPPPRRRSRTGRTSAAALYAYRRISGAPVLGAVVPRASDMPLYTDAPAASSRGSRQPAGARRRRTASPRGRGA